MTSTLAEKAVVGRRIVHDHQARKAQLPGIITRVDNDGEYPGVWVRLDGERHNMFVPRKFFWRLTFLDEVVPVPDLPMGRFHPTADDFGGDWEGVPVLQCESEDIVILTGDQLRATVALHAFCKDMGIDREYLPAMQPRWAVFEWEPEDAEYPWTVRWDAAEGEDQAIRIYFLPA
ncbi:hypothetical protein AB0G67_40260 [Streptomyces sp. NPDC021056]|uniref:hypothetical protein n=1 Tax=Streptomyces sp. NPDC021056 TaxID=3155012 RepID=UPI0033D2710E